MTRAAGSGGPGRFPAQAPRFLHDQGLGNWHSPSLGGRATLSAKPFSVNDLASSFAVGLHLLTVCAQFSPGLEKFFNLLNIVDIVTRAHKQSTAYPQPLVSPAEPQRL
ncbi:MAG: hypothetical protein AMXMBFR59_09230 [Rhodanobacteraceae bacterium]